MVRSFIKRMAVICVSAAMLITGFTGTSYTADTDTVSAAGTSYHFDFGGGGTASGYTGVSASTGYSSSQGYGFANTSKVKNVSASGSGALSDAVQFTDLSSSNTFNVDLPNGLYRVTVTLGNATRTSVSAEGVLQIINMTGTNATDSILIPITDGQLNIMATNGKSGYPHTFSALDIEWVSSDTQLPPTVWFCGDSTVCNYYPKATSTQAGWGQVFDQYIDTSKWQVRNMAASGQYAAGFVNGGQFAPIMKYGKAGDVYIISIGINDTNYSNKEEYKNVVTDMVKQAKAKGMQVILVKQQGRKGDYSRNPLLTSRWFAAQLDEIGSEQNVQVLDLFNLFQDYCISVGAAKADTFFVDNLHPNRQGAMKLAELAASQIDLGSGYEPESGTLIQTLDVVDNSNRYNWHIAGDAQVGSTIYGDRTFTYTSLPDALLGTEYIQTACDSKLSTSDLAKFTAAADMTVYVALDNRVENLPAWLADWKKTSMTAQSSNDVTFDIYSKSVTAGEMVTLGANGQSSYCVNYTVFASTAPEAPEKIIGDINTDGEFSIADAVMMQKFLLNISSLNDMQAGDVNGDGRINVFDLSMMKKHIRTEDALSGYPSDNDTPGTDEEESQLYYAIDQTYSSAVEETSNAGYKADAYVNFDNMVGSFIEWKVNVPADGNYLCTFNIANGSANDRQMKIEVNNASDYWLQPFLTTSSWTTWQERAIVLPLVKGQNIIRMTSMTAEGGPNLDYLRVEWTDEPIAEIYVPEEKPPVTDDGGDVTIYIAGDSTVQSYKASYAPQQGWGYYLGNYFSSNTAVSNHAIAGRSSKSFYDNGRLDTILNSIQSGDYLLIQFGINDGAYNKAERYAPTCGTVPGTSGSFEFYMAKYIEGAKAKGATPILITPTLSLKNYKNGKFVSSYTNYTDSVKKLASYYNVPYIELNGLMVDHYNKIGYDKAYTYHMCSTGTSDMTHFTETGANAVAGLIANAIKGLGLDISGRVK